MNSGMETEKKVFITKCANFGVKTKKKGFSSQNLRKKKRLLLINTKSMTSILGVSGLELLRTSSGTEPATFFGTQS